MKKTIIPLVALLLSMNVCLSQVTLNCVIPTTENVDQISLFGTIIYYSTNSGLFNYECGDFEPDHISTNSVNDIYSYNAVSNDTICLNRTPFAYYYGKSNGVYSSAGTVSTSIPVNAIATDETNVYALNKYSSDYNFLQISGITTNLTGSNINGIDFDGIENLTDLDYFQFNGNDYLAIVSPAPYGFKLYNLTEGKCYNTDQLTITSSTYANGTLYVAIDNDIYTLTDIVDLNTITKTVTLSISPSFSIQNGQTINEFTFDLSGSNITVAASNGVYSECSSTASISENYAESINVYPNPFTSQFTVSNLEQGEEFEIVNIQGKLVYKGESTNVNGFSIDLEVEPGVYFIKLMNTNKTIQLISQ